MSHHRKRLRQAPSLNTSLNCNVSRTLFSESSPSRFSQAVNLEDSHFQKLGGKQLDWWMDISHIPVYTNIKINDNNKIYLNNNFLNQKEQKMKSLSSEQLGDRILQFDVKKGSNRLKNMHKKFTTTQNTTNNKQSAKRSKTKNLPMHQHKDIKQESRPREEESDKQNIVQQWSYHQKQAVINNLNLNNQIRPNASENILNFDYKNNKKLMKTKENKKKNIPYHNKNTLYTAEEYHNITLAKTINKCLDMNKLQERFQQLEKKITTNSNQERPILSAQKFNQDKQIFQQENELQHRIGLNLKTQTLQTPFISKGHSKTSSLTIANIESINNELNLGLKIIDDSFQIETTEKQNFFYLDNISYKNSFTFNVSDRACDRNQYRIHMDPQQIEDIILDQSIISPQCHKLTNELNKILQSQSGAKDEQIDQKIFKLTNPHTRTNTNSIVPPLKVDRKQCQSFLESHQCQCTELMNDDEECNVQIQLQKEQLILVEYVGMLVHSFEYRLICDQSYLTCCKMVEYFQTILQEISYPNILNIYRLKYRRMRPNFLSTKQKQLYIISEQQLYSDADLEGEGEDKVEGKCTIYKQPVLISDLYKKVYNMASLMGEQQNINNCKTDRTYPMTNEKRHQNSADSINKDENKIFLSWAMVQKLTKQLILSINYLNKVNLSQKFKANQNECLIGNLFTINLHMIYLCRIDFEKQGAPIQKYLYTFKIDVADIENMMQNHRNNYEWLLLQNLETIYSVILFLCNEAQKVTDDQQKYQETKYLCSNFLTHLEDIIQSGMGNTNPTNLLQKMVIHPYISEHVPTAYEKQFMSLLY